MAATDFASDLESTLQSVFDGPFLAGALAPFTWVGDGVFVMPGGAAGAEGVIVLAEGTEEDDDVVAGDFFKLGLFSQIGRAHV